MKKKLLGLILASAMIMTLLAGCGGGSDDTDSGEPYEVSIQFVGLFEENSNVEAVEEAINAISVPEINCTVNIEPIFIGDLATKTSLGIAGGEKLDIVTVGLTHPIATMVAGGMLLELDDLIEEYGKDAAEVTKNVADAQKINGVTYAISGYPYAAMGGGFVYNKTLADQYGIEMHDEMTFEELTMVAETLKQNNVYLTTFGNSGELNFKFFESIEAYGQAGSYGGIMDPTESTEIENIYETEKFENYCLTVNSWAKAGYLPSDQLTDETRIQEYFTQQKIFGTSTGYNVGQIASWIDPNFETEIIQMAEPIISTSGAGEFMLGIAANSKNPKKAMEFINLIYANEKVANLLQYGIEGTDYKMVEGTENVITAIGTANEDHNSYYSPFVHFGDPMKLKIVSPLTDSFYDELAAFEETAKKSKSFGYTFDGSAYAAEAGAIANVVAEYLPLLNAGLAPDVDKQISEFQKALKDAGIEDVIAANQKQLDEYLGN